MYVFVGIVLLVETLVEDSLLVLPPPPAGMKVGTLVAGTAVVNAVVTKETIVCAVFVDVLCCDVERWA